MAILNANSPPWVFGTVSITTMPVTFSSGKTSFGVPLAGSEDLQRMKTVSQLCHTFRIWNGIGD